MIPNYKSNHYAVDIISLNFYDIYPKNKKKEGIRFNVYISIFILKNTF